MLGVGIGRVGKVGGTAPSAGGLTPPIGFVFRVDSDGYYQTDADGFYLVEQA